MRNWHLRPAAYTTESVAANYQLTVTYHYDASGALSEVTGPDGTRYWQALARNARGQLLGVLLGNRVATFNAYDPATGELMGRTSGIGQSTDVQALTYQYDVTGNLKSRADANQGLSETFKYDNLNRLTESDLTANGTTSPDLTVTYDEIGNIKTKSDVGTYTYDPSHPHAVQSIDPTINGATVNRGVKTSYDYDANGNTLSGNNKTYAWTAFNKPWKIDASGNESQFWYAPDRRRYKQVTTTGGVTTTTLYIGGLMTVIEQGGLTTYRHNIIAGGKIIAIYSNTSALTQQIRYLHYDVQGSVNAVTDGSGTVVARMSFSAFGQRRDPQTWQVPEDATAVANDRDQTFRGYTNQEELDAVSLIHMNGRVYDPQVGRFTSADPFVQAPFFSQSLNRYSYVWNNPLTFVDPSGFKTIVCYTDEDGHRVCYDQDKPDPGVPTNGSSTKGNMHVWPKTSDKGDGGYNQMLYNSLTRGSGSSRFTGGVGNGGNGYGYGRFTNPTYLVSTSVGGAGILADIASHSKVYGGYWQGKNGKWNSLDWGGNGATGARSVAVRVAARLKMASRLLGAAGATISIYQAYAGQISPAKAGLDIFMMGVSEAGLPGFAIGMGYFIIDSTVGWPAALRAQAQLIERDQAIMGPGWSPFGGSSKW